MGNNILKNQYADPSLETLLAQITYRRNAVLFLGSGFSASAMGLTGDEMPLASDLANKIGNLKDFNGESDLKYATSRFLKDNGDSTELIRMLKETFTVRHVEEHHKAIASAPWRRVYTTNYDLCYETAAAQVGKLIDTVDLHNPPSDYSGRNDICIHLNGSILSLNAESIDNEFKLTASSYLSPDSFITSKWFYPFQRDLEYSTAIVFVGYSMYDIEVQKILHDNPDYRSKTYFITRSLKGGKEQFTLEQFGMILPIGTVAFGEAIAKKTDEFSDEPHDFTLSSLWEYKVSDKDIPVRDQDVDSFLLFGKSDDDLIDSSVKEIKGAPMLIQRDNIKFVDQLLQSNVNVAVLAEFGNGKTIFLKELRARLSLSGTRVFIADYYEPHQHEDLETLVKSGTTGYLIIDSYENNFSLIKHYAELSPDKLKLIISARTSIHERYRSLLQEIGLKINEISIDELSREESTQFINIIENIGSWGKNAALPDHEKYKIIKKNKNQISQNLLALLSSPQIVDRVKELIKEILSVPKYKDTLFAIGVLSSNDMELSSSLISRIALNDSIYNIELRNNNNFQQIFRPNGTKIVEKSSIFAISLISNHFSSTYIVDQLLKIVSSLDGESDELWQLQKNLMRFSVVERFLPERQRMQSLIRYYENLKREVPWLTKDPHFWLQYGMAQLTFKNYPKAQAYFEQAYSWADRKLSYHTDHIDTQQARLYLMKASTEIDQSDMYKLFNSAHQIIVKLPEDIHKYRQVELYKDIFDSGFTKFSRANRNNFEHACNIINKDLEKAIFDELILPSRRGTANKINEMLKDILSKIKLSKAN